MIFLEENKVRPLVLCKVRERIVSMSLKEFLNSLNSVEKDII